MTSADGSETVLDLFERSVARSPEAVALVQAGGESFTYSQLSDVAASLAERIRPSCSGAAGRRPLVCLMMQRHMPLVASMLAVLRCGAAYVPVDPSFPPERQSYIFAHSQCSLLIADEESHRAALELGVRLPPAVVVAETGEVLSSYLAEGESAVGNALLDSGVSGRSAEEAMYVLYTSGSTGKPKGVVVRHRGVANVVQWFAKELGLTSESRVLALTTVCFDISVLEIYMPLTSGGTLVLADSGSQKNPYRLLELVSSARVNVVQATPTTFEMLLATGWRGDSSLDLLVGGEAFRPSLLPLLGTCRSIRNVYGPTETTIWSSCFLLPGHADKLPLSGTGVGVSVPIGSPISRTAFYLVDPESEQLAMESEGELWIGGVGVAEGYLNAPELTSARFLRNPFGEGMVYRTGDLVRRMSSGDYVFVRRLDDQVKVDGFRIELSEVETVYSQHPLVEQAVAAVKDNRLVVFLKPQKNLLLSVADERSIHRAAAESLTHYMMPK